tara:strand:- start:27551 stop:28435 length:885 start_codon:yes stop_codon:yes gene_type:complete
MKKLTFLLFFLVSSLFAQKTEFKGRLLDKVTNEPIVYANLSFLDSNLGISTTEEGTFIMYINKKFLNSKIHISCLNYKDTIVVAKDLLNTTLFLNSKTEILDEIVLSKKLNKQVILDPIKRGVQNMHSSGLRMIAKYFPNTKKNVCCNYITKVEVQFPKRQNQQSKFRFRIFDRNPATGFPKDDLLTESIPITIKKGETSVFLDLENYGIEMPENGFFIAFEKLFIPFNEYGEDESNDETGKFYSPVMGMTKSREYKKVIRNYIYAKGKWSNLGMLNKGILKGYVPAISVTLSN